MAFKALPFSFGEVREDNLRYQRLRSPSTLNESLSATYDISHLDTPVMSVARITSLNKLKEGRDKKTSASELNEAFPDLIEPFKTPLPMVAAEEIARRQRQRQNLQRTIQDGPQGLFYDVARFGAALLPHAMDPINWGVGLLMSGGVGLAFSGSRVAAALGIGSRSATTGQIFLRGAVEGTLENLAIEPITALAAAQDYDQYAIEDFFINSVGSAIGFAGARYGVVKTSQGIKRGVSKIGEYVNRINPKHGDMVQRVAISQVGNDIRPDISPITRNIINESNGDVPGRMPNQRYTFSKIDDGAVGKTAFYSGSQHRGVNLDQAPPEILHTDYGNGVYLTDHPGIANGAAARSLDSQDGTVFQIKVKEGLNYLDLEKPFPVDLATKISKATDEFIDLQRPAKEVLEDISDSISLEKLSDNAIENIKDIVSEAGFAGYRHNGGRFLGVPGNESNHLIVFDPKNLESSTPLRADNSTVPRPNLDEVRGAQSRRLDPRNNFLFDEDISRRLDEALKTQATDPKFEEVRKLEQDAFEELEALDGQELLNAAEKKTLDELKDLLADDALNDKTIKSAIACMSGVASV